MCHVASSVTKIISFFVVVSGSLTCLVVHAVSRFSLLHRPLKGTAMSENPLCLSRCTYSSEKWAPMRDETRFPGVAPTRRRAPASIKSASGRSAFTVSLKLRGGRDGGSVLYSWHQRWRGGRRSHSGCLPADKGAWLVQTKMTIDFTVACERTWGTAGGQDAAKRKLGKRERKGANAHTALFYGDSQRLIIPHHETRRLFFQSCRLASAFQTAAGRARKAKHDAWCAHAREKTKRE